MDKKLRCNVVRAMETLGRCINDEEIFETWLLYGVADGDIDETTTDEELEYYITDDELAYLMRIFTLMMKQANKSGGLYVDGVVSREEDVYE